MRGWGAFVQDDGASNGTDLIYGYHTDWGGENTTDPNLCPESFGVTWSSTSGYGYVTINGVTNNATADPDYAFALGVQRATNYASPAGSGSYASCYPLQDNRNGTVIGLGGTMRHFTLSDSWNTNTAQMDANLFITGRSIVGSPSDLRGYALLPPGGGYITAGGSTHWMTNAVPVAVNSAGQVLGLEGSTTNSVAATVAGENPAWSGAPYYSNTNTVYNIPTIWLPQTNSGGTVTGYTPARLTMPSTNIT